MAVTCIHVSFTCQLLYRRSKEDYCVSRLWRCSQNQAYHLQTMCCLHLHIYCVDIKEEMICPTNTFLFPKNVKLEL